MKGLTESPEKEVMRVEAVVPVEQDVKGMNTTRSSADSRTNEESLTRRRDASLRHTLEPPGEECLPLGALVGPLPHYHAPVLGHPVNCLGQATTGQPSPTENLLCQMARGTVPPYPGIGGDQDTNLVFRPFLLPVILDPLLTMKTPDVVANGIETRVKQDLGEVVEAVVSFPKTPGLIIPPWKRSISSCWVWTVACQRRLAPAAVAAYLM